MEQQDSDPLGLKAIESAALAAALAFLESSRLQDERLFKEAEERFWAEPLLP
jgi:hypothetical protein